MGPLRSPGRGAGLASHIGVLRAILLPRHHRDRFLGDAYGLSGIFVVISSTPPIELPG